MSYSLPKSRLIDAHVAGQLKLDVIILQADVSFLVMKHGNIYISRNPQ